MSSCPGPGAGGHSTAPGGWARRPSCPRGLRLVDVADSAYGAQAPGESGAGFDPASRPGEEPTGGGRLGGAAIGATPRPATASASVSRVVSMVIGASERCRSRQHRCSPAIPGSCSSSSTGSAPAPRLPAPPHDAGTPQEDRTGEGAPSPPPRRERVHHRRAVHPGDSGVHQGFSSQTPHPPTVRRSARPPPLTDRCGSTPGDPHGVPQPGRPPMARPGHSRPRSPAGAGPRSGMWAGTLVAEAAAAALGAQGGVGGI